MKIPEDFQGMYTECMMRSERDVVTLRPALLQELIERIATLTEQLEQRDQELAQARAEIERLKLQSEHADCWWDDDNRVGSPEEYADEEALKVGEEFELHAAAYWPTKYRVTAVRDHETDEGEYTCELLKGRREEFETYFQIKSERDSLRAQLEQMSRPVTHEESFHFEDDEVLRNVEGTDFIKSRLELKLRLSTSGEKWSLYRAIAKLVVGARARRQEKP